MNNALYKKLFIILSLVAVGFLAYKFLYNEGVVNSIGNGAVVEKNENSLVVRGYLESPTEEKKVISVEFSVTSKTVFKKKGIIVDVEKHSDGKPFTPEIVESAGQFSEVRAGTVIKGVKTKDKLVDGGTAEALEVSYSEAIFQ